MHENAMFQNLDTWGPGLTGLGLDLHPYTVVQGNKVWALRRPHFLESEIDIIGMEVLCFFSPYDQVLHLAER